MRQIKEDFERVMQRGPGEATSFSGLKSPTPSTKRDTLSVPSSVYLFPLSYHLALLAFEGWKFPFARIWVCVCVCLCVKTGEPQIWVFVPLVFL